MTDKSVPTQVLHEARPAAQHHLTQFRLHSKMKIANEKVMRWLHNGKSTFLEREAKADEMAELKLRLMNIRLPQVPLKIQQPIQDWDVVKHLGSGSFGEAFQLKDRNGTSDICVKEVDIERHRELLKKVKGRNMTYDDASNFYCSLVREWDIHCKVRHPHIINMYHASFGHRLTYFFMERASTDLETVLKECRGPLPLPYTRKYFQQLISAVQYLHGMGIAHRDLKPNNLLIDSDGQLRVADFGMAERFQLENGCERLMTDVLSAKRFRAPEIVAKDLYRAAPVDIWACGIILSLMLIGWYPWDLAEMSDLRYAFWMRRKRFACFPNDINAMTADLNYILVPDPELRPTADHIANHVFGFDF